MIPGNINTPTGIANWILNNFDPTSELLIVEVDSYFVGEIARSLKIVPPDIAILTNIGDQHLERFGTKTNLKKALLEVFDYTKPQTTQIRDKQSNLEYALEVAKLLKIPSDIIKDTVSKLKKPDRRGDLKIINNFEVIDESYNISFSTAKSTLQNAVELAKSKGKKLIVITAGIPELGQENKDANKQLGLLLSQKADKVILLKSILHKQVLNESNKFTLASNLSEAWKILENFDPKKYLVLLQPELNDLYY
jgi:UDP-N-acetylmuramyl pentapeptide synthase